MKGGRRGNVRMKIKNRGLGNRRGLDRRGRRWRNGVVREWRPERGCKVEREREVVEVGRRRG